MSAIDGRDRILGRIRSSLGVSTDDAQRRVHIQKRLFGHPKSIVPAAAMRPAPELISAFRKALEGQSATISEAMSAADIPVLIGRFLRDNNLPAKLRMGDDDYLVRAPWQNEPTLERLHGAAEPEDEVSLSTAIAGAAETGTLFLVSGTDNPTTLNFLPETHIIVIKETDIFGAYEDVWQRIRDTYCSRTMPRTVNMISGPSRTADIEQTIIMGAHGPKRLHVIIVKS